MCINHRKDLPPVKPRKKKSFPLKDNEMTVNQKLQLIPEKLDKQE